MAVGRFEEAGIAWQRPSDYYAEMVGAWRADRQRQPSSLSCCSFRSYCRSCSARWLPHHAPLPPDCRRRSSPTSTWRASRSSWSSSAARLRRRRRGGASARPRSLASRCGCWPAAGAGRPGAEPGGSDRAVTGLRRAASCFTPSPHLPTAIAPPPPPPHPTHTQHHHHHPGKPHPTPSTPPTHPPLGGG